MEPGYVCSLRLAFLSRSPHHRLGIQINGVLIGKGKTAILKEGNEVAFGTPNAQPGSLEDYRASVLRSCLTSRLKSSSNRFHIPPYRCRPTVEGYSRVLRHQSRARKGLLRHRHESHLACHWTVVRHQDDPREPCTTRHGPRQLAQW